VIRALFVSYAFVKAAHDFVPAPARRQAWPARIGVLKRFLRLVEHLPADAVEVHWVHYGGLDRGDPLVGRVAPRLRRYAAPLYEPAPRGRLHTRLRERGRMIGYVGRHLVHRIVRPGRSFTADGVPVDEMAAFADFLRRLGPDVMVLAEQPTAGRMRAVSEAGRQLGILQVAINDRYPDMIKERLLQDEPQIAGWFLLGLAEPGAPDRFGDRMWCAPPLLAETAGAREDADLTILGYDPDVALQGIRFLQRCPAGTVGRLVAPALSRRQRRAWEREARGVALRFAPMPDEDEYRALLAGSRVVFGKNGFQQIAEALAVGTPMIAWEVEGGVPGFGLEPAFQPFVRFVTDAPASWDAALSAARAWLAVRPAMPWVGEVAALGCPSRHAAALFGEFLGDVVRARRAAAAMP